MNLPKARTSDLLQQEAASELMIYDLRINKAYSLNETLKNVFCACDGKTSFDDFKRKHKYTDDLIFFALDELKRNNLTDGAYASPLAGIGRREAIKRAGLATLAALPVIASLTAPKAIHAASGFCIGVQCPFANNDCQEDGYCDPAMGNDDCIIPLKPDGTPCEDGDPNTIGSVCQNGFCVGGTAPV